MANVKKALDAKQGGTVWLVDPRDLTRVTDENHPLYDPTVHDAAPEWLVKAIRKGYDRTQVIVVRKNGQKEGKDVLEIVDGRSRHASSLIVADELEAQFGPEGRLRVPVVLAQVKNDVDLAGIMIRTRYLKKRVDVITQAEQVFDYMDKFGRDAEESAAIFKLTPKTINNYRTLVQLCPAVKAAVRKGKLAAHDAISTFANLSREEQEAMLPSVLTSSPRRTVEDGEDEEEDSMTGGPDTGGGAGGSGGKSKGKGKAKGKKELSPLARLRIIFRSPEAMEASSKRERVMFSWVFGEATLSDLKEVHEALATAIEKARKKVPKA